MIIHGTLDTVTPVSNSTDILNMWREWNEMNPVSSTDQNGCDVYVPSSNAAEGTEEYVELVHCDVEGMKHARAGFASSPEDGTVAPFTSTEIAWDFITRFKGWE